MSASKENTTDTQAAENELSDELVRQYLLDNSDFLQRNSDLLDHLHIPHASGSAVSLVEKQVSIMRERNVDMRRRLSTLTGNARDNDKLYEQTSSMVLGLLEASSPTELSKTFLASMSRDFDVEYASIIIFGEDAGADDYRLESADDAMEHIGALLKGRKAVCGPLREEELSYLFPNAGQIGSAALMPIGTDHKLGLIAVGSSDASRYGSDMGTLFLSHIADVLARVLPRLTQGSA